MIEPNPNDSCVVNSLSLRVDTENVGSTVELRRSWNGIGSVFLPRRPPRRLSSPWPRWILSSSYSARFRPAGAGVDSSGADFTR